jgi:hypothetical protein
MTTSRRAATILVCGRLAGTRRRGPALVEPHPGGVGAGAHLEVGAIEVGVDEGGGDAVSLTVLLGDLHVVAAVVLCTVAGRG